MQPPNLRLWSATLFLLTVGLLTFGCETDGPEFGSGDTRIIEGRLESDENLDTEFFMVTRAGTINILATTIIGTNPETGGPIVAPLLGVSIGAPDPEDETACQLTFSQVLSEGESYSVYFREGLFCVSMFRNPGSIEGGIYDYVVTLTGAFGGN